MRQLLGFAGLLLAASASAAGRRIWEIRVQMIAPPSMRMMPRTISTRPGQFDRSPKPAPGREGSRVPLAGGAARGRFALRRPRQIGWAADSNIPATNKPTPSQMTSMLVSLWRCVVLRKVVEAGGSGNP
jgi:hypothetical protein